MRCKLRSTRRLSKGAMLAVNYTFSKSLGICCDDLSSGSPAIEIPQYFHLSRTFEPTDRTHDFNVSGMMAVPFGSGKRFLSHGVACSHRSAGGR